MESKDLLSSLPKDLKQLLGRQYLTAGSLFHLARTSKFFRQSLVEADNSSKQAYANLLDSLRRLLSHAALGEWDEARAIWSQTPSLLTCRGTVYHPNPQEIKPYMNPGRYKYNNLTPWQIAWVNEEYEFVEEMAEYMDDEQKLKQFLEIFPNGELIKHNWDLEEAKKRLHNVFKAVFQDPTIDENDLKSMNKSTRKALNKLYTYVKPAPDHQIGLVFDNRIYLEALLLFQNTFKQSRKDLYNQHNASQRLFWRVRVIEHLASLSGTSHLRLHARGIQFYENNRRSGCTLMNGLPYYSFRRPSNSLPGFHFFVAVGYDRYRVKCKGKIYDCGADHFQKGMEQKQKKGQALRDKIYTTRHRPSP